MIRVRSYDGITFDRSAHPEQVFGAYESVHQWLAGLDKIVANLLPPIEDTLPPAYFVPVKAADVNQSVNMVTLDWAPDENYLVAFEEVGERQEELSSGRGDLLRFLPTIMESATRVFDDSVPGRRRRSRESQDRIDMFRNAVEAYRILAQGRMGYNSLETDQEKSFFDSNYRDYLRIYRDLHSQFMVLAGYARRHKEKVASNSDRDRIGRRLPQMAEFVRRLPDAEEKLREARSKAARIVADAQANFVSQNTREVYEAQRGWSTFRFADRIEDETVVLSLDNPDPRTGRFYNDAEKLRIDDARQAVLARLYEEWACGSLAADASARLNQLLGGRGGRFGDFLSQINYGNSEHGARTFDHTAVYIGPPLEPESVIYDPWTRQTTITTAADLTVPAVHRYDQTDGYEADGYDWTDVAEWYIDWDRLEELDADPPVRELGGPETVHDIEYASLEYARTHNPPADRRELSAYGMSATAASNWQTDLDLFPESSDGWAQDHPAQLLAPPARNLSSVDSATNWGPTLPSSPLSGSGPPPAEHSIGSVASFDYYGDESAAGLGQTDVAGAEFLDEDDLDYSYQQDEFYGGYYGSNSGPSAYVVAVDNPAEFRPSLPGSVDELTSRYDELRALMERHGPVLADVLDRTETRPHWDTLASAMDSAEVNRQLRDLGFAATRPLFADHRLLLDQIIDRLGHAVTSDDAPAAAALQELRGWLGGSDTGGGTRPGSDSDSELLAQAKPGRPPAEPDTESLTDFLTGASPMSETSVRPGAYEAFAAGLHRPDPAVPNLYSPVGVDPARDGSLGRDVAELVDAGLAEALAATSDVPALHLPVAEHGGRVTESDVRRLNHTLELFAQAGVLPVVATRGAIDAETAQVLDRYGALAWHAASGDGPESGGRFRLRRPGSRGRTGQPGGTYAGIDAQAHESAVSQARPTVVDKAPEPILEVLLEESPQRQRDLMNDRPELVTSDDFLERVTGMGERVPNVPAVRLLRPDVRLRRLGLPDTVHDYVATPAMDRPNILLETVGQLHERGEDTAVLAELVDAQTADVTDGTAGEAQNRDFLVDLLEALDQAKAGEFTGARTTDGEFAGVEAFVDANRHRLTDSDTKYRILEALGTYHQTLSTDAEKQQVQALQFAVSKCL